MQEKHLKRDSSGAVVNTDNSGLEEYKKRRVLLKRKDQKIDDLEKRIARLEKLIDGN